MNCKIQRLHYLSTGIFGRLTIGDQAFATAEHAYQTPVDSWTPKVASGSYTCMRHPPNRMPYVTFELQNVPDFQGQPVTGILLHIGNYPQTDSEGCFLVGYNIVLSTAVPYVNNSKMAFNEFMDLQKDVDSFILEIE